MRVWLIKNSEWLPIDEKANRLLRLAQLAKLLADRGHEVVYWTSTFNHFKKAHRPDFGETDVPCDGYTVRLLHTPGYKRNISLRRVADHVVFGLKIARRMRAFVPPDVILSTHPPIESNVAAVQYGRAQGVPVVVDMRDMWPDLFSEPFPAPVRSVARVGYSAWTAQTRWAFANATALFGISEEFVQWGLRYAKRERNPQDLVWPHSVHARDDKLCDERFVDALEIPGDEVVVSFFGTLMPFRYEMAPVFEAARRLPTVKFVICGDGPGLVSYKEETRDLGNVLWPGWVNEAQIGALLARSQLGLLPYKDRFDFRAAFPTKVIDYFSGGVGVVSGVRGAVDTLLERFDCGFCYDERDPQSLARELSRRLEEPGVFERFGRNAKRLFHEEFELGVVYDRVIERLERIASDRRGV